MSTSIALYKKDIPVASLSEATNLKPESGNSTLSITNQKPSIFTSRINILYLKTVVSRSILRKMPQHLQTRTKAPFLGTKSYLLYPTKHLSSLTKSRRRRIDI